MGVATRELVALAARQHSAITDAQLKQLGVSSHQRRRLVADGWLEHVLDGTYRLAGHTDLELARCVAACARPGGLVIAGPAAGRLWGYRRMPKDGRIQVIAPRASHPSTEPWLQAYRTTAINPWDVVHRHDGIRVTSPPRTAVDLMRYLPEQHVRSVVDQIIAAGQCTADTMRRVAEPLATPGRPWARRFLDLLDARPGGGAAESDWESQVCHELVRRGVHDLIWQRWLDVPNWGPIRLDGAVEELRWGVEVDVHPDHFTEAGVDADDSRDVACQAIGWCVSRATGLSLSADFTGTIDSLVAVYEQRCREAGVRPGTSR
jgi:hypothetical protein